MKPAVRPKKPSAVIGSIVSDFKDWFWLGIALLIGAVVRFVNLSKSSIWHDEGYTMMLAPQNPLDIIARTARDVHPPLHYLVLHYWMKLFGTSEIAARSLSVLLMLGVIVIGYLLTKRLFGHASARLAAIFLAIGPFIVRYSQEARMYALVAFFLLAATWILVRLVQEGRRHDWWWYAAFMAAALYTHYYAIFIIAAHWLYVLVLSFKKSENGFKGLADWRWWATNAAAAILFLPWVPAAYAQFSRVQASFWIPAVGPHTMPATLGQFLTYTDLGALPLLRTALALVFLATLLVMFWHHRDRFSSLVALAAYSLLAPLAVFVLSFKRPIYIDRYFVFAAVGFYILLAVMHYYAQPWDKLKSFRIGSIVLLLLSFSIGLRNVYVQSNHQMRQTGQYVSQGFQPGDVVVSGELYTYFDFAYYNRTGQPAKLLAPNGLSGYGETSLLYDRESEIVVRQLSDVRPASGRVWVVGKTGPHDYFDDVPSHWAPIGGKFTAGYTAAQLYQVQ